MKWARGKRFSKAVDVNTAVCSEKHMHKHDTFGWHCLPCLAPVYLMLTDVTGPPRPPPTCTVHACIWQAIKELI